MKRNGDHFGVGIIWGSLWGSFQGWGHLGGCTVLVPRTQLGSKFHSINVNNSINPGPYLCDPKSLDRWSNGTLSCSQNRSSEDLVLEYVYASHRCSQWLRESPFQKMPCFISCLSGAVDGHRMNWCCFRARAVETLLTILDTVHFGMPPTVSYIHTYIHTYTHTYTLLSIPKKGFSASILKLN